MSDIKKLLESFSNIETTVTEGKPIGHAYKFKDYLGATEPVRKQKPGVLATKKQTSKLVGDADGDGGATEESAQLEEDMVAQMAREFADFLNNKKPVMDDIFPTAQDRELGNKPEDRELAAEASLIQQPAQLAAKTAQPAAQQPAQPVTQQPAAKTAQPAAQQPEITNIASRLSKLLGMDATQLKAAYQAPNPNPRQLGVLAAAFKKLAAIGPVETAKAMTLLKQISSEETGQPQ